MNPGRGSTRGRPRAERSRLLHALRARARPTDADSLRAYLGSPLPVLGVRVPALRQVVRAARARLEPLPPSTLRSVLVALWNGEWYEERALAIELLYTYLRLDDRRAWELARRWVGSATGWALSDSLAAGPVARMAHARPERFVELLNWTRSANLWRRRASAYALRDWVYAGELAWAFRLIDRLARDPEFWVQRAVGTWLRECWKRGRRPTEAFLRSHAPDLSSTAITVATERAPPQFRQELRRAHRRARTTQLRRL